MKPSAYFLNLGRGPIADEAALAAALKADQIAGACLDVLETEPIPPNSPLLDASLSGKLLITPHIGWAPLEARQRCIDETIKNINNLT